MNDGDQERVYRGGQGLVEYVLLLILIAIICVTALSLLGRRTESLIPTANEFEGSSKEDG